MKSSPSSLSSYMIQSYLSILNFTFDKKSNFWPFLTEIYQIAILKPESDNYDVYHWIRQFNKIISS